MSGDPRLTEADGPPDPGGCTTIRDVGSMHHDTISDIWYECMLDPRDQTIEWTILPPND